MPDFTHLILRSTDDIHGEKGNSLRMKTEVWVYEYYIPNWYVPWGRAANDTLSTSKAKCN